jgi:hypothetical protein
MTPDLRIAIATLALVVAGCSGGTTAQLPTSTAPLGAARSVAGFVRPGYDELYVSGTVGAIQIFTQPGQGQMPYALISGPYSQIAEPQELFVDKNLTLYVADDSRVEVFPVANTRPSELLTQAGFVNAVAVDSHGTVYVANYAGVTAGTVLAYRRHHTKPTATIASFSGGTFPLGVAVDAADNLYVSYDKYEGSDHFAGGVLKYRAGSGPGVDLGIKAGLVNGITFDRQGNLLLVDENLPGVDVFAPGTKSPSKQILVSGAVQASLNRANTELWIAAGGAGMVFGVSYPDGKLLDTIAAPLGADGVAATRPSPL